MTPKAEQAYLEARNVAKRKNDVLGFVLTGSRGKGLATVHSDYDFALFVKDDALKPYQARFHNRTYGAHLYLFTLASFQTYLAWEGDQCLG